MRPGPSLSERKSLLRTALSFAAASNRLIRRALAAGSRARVKEDGTCVTDADIAAERLLRGLIARRFPEHGILGEELPARNPGAEFQWVLDPIDGTLSFTRGIPLFGTILALRHHGAPVLGVIALPVLRETYSAAAGLGAFRNAEKFHIAARLRDAADEIVAMGDREQFVRCGKLPAFERLMRRHPRVRTYPDCFGHALAARGAVGAMVDFDLNPWDIAATQVLVEEAGGKYVCWLGRKTPQGRQRYNVVFGKPGVVDRLLPILA